MKRLFALIVELMLICGLAGIAMASEATDCVRSEGYAPSVIEASDGHTRCDCLLEGSAAATLAWTDGGNVYGVSGDPDALGELYLMLLPLEAWDTCRYIVDQEVLACYGLDTDAACATLGAYLLEMERVFTDPDAVSAGDVLDAPESAYAPGFPFSIRYVLNTNTKKFHTPDCRSVKQIKDKNRQDYSGSRDDVIAMGYKPCKICNP